MKILTLGILLLFILGFTAVPELKSEKLRSIVCSKITYANYFVFHENCLDGTIVIIGGDNFRYQDIDYRIVLNTAVSFSGSRFQVNLYRDVSIIKGEVELGKWYANLEYESFGDYHNVARANKNDSNVEEIKTKKEINGLPKLILDWEGYQAESYVSKEDYSYFRIISENVVIGYISYVWYADENEDLKGYVSQNFDLNGNMIGPEGNESWSYNE